ncbi:YceI family protein [Marinicellulosiphila megalodicopiae]|uniref:YceI family protein n=1 Tax=Marinicellulosiphila megalodicopiae TaxID=2724896 RepID=UPI003BAEB9EF
MKKLPLAYALVAALTTSIAANAADYNIDQTHTTIEFKASHLGFSYVIGRFDDFEGTFSYDPAKPEASKVMATIDTTSINSNHTARDKHLKSDDFLNAAKFPEATFVSTSFKVTDEDNAVMMGNFTLNGVTKPVSIDVAKIGEGKDPWGGYRAGFEGSFEFGMDEFDFKSNYGKVMIDITVEGIKK